MAIFRKKYRVGLDIGDHSVKGASVDQGSLTAKVWKDVIHPHRSGKNDDLPDSTWSARVKECLTKHRKLFDRAKQQVVVGIQGNSVTTGYLPLPKLKSEEIELAVRSTVTREVPFPIESLDTVFLKVEPLPGDDFAVFYSAWKKRTAQRLEDVVKACDLKVARMEVSGVALTRQLYRNHELDPEAFYLMVNIGFKVTQIAVVRGGYPYFLRDVPIGGRDITYAIQVGTQVNWDEAEEVKKSLPLFELIHTAGPVLSELQYEVKRTVEYFCRKYPCQSISELFLSGGTSLLADFSDWLEEETQLSVTVEEWNKFEVEGADAALHNVAVGLALS